MKPTSQPKNPNKLSRYSDYTITCHAKQRMYERYSISSTQEIQKLTKSAKEKGILINSLSLSNYESFNLSYDTYSYLKNHYAAKSNNWRNYYYKDKVFILGGKSSRTLISVVPCSQEDILNNSSKKDEMKKMMLNGGIR